MTDSMTRVFRATAPGKLILIGEYAVLEGAPAISAAVDRFAVAELHVTAGQSALRIANTGNCFPFSYSGEAVDWHIDPGIFGDVLVAASGVVVAAGVVLFQHLDAPLRVVAVDGGASSRLGEFVLYASNQRTVSSSSSLS